MQTASFSECWRHNVITSKNEDRSSTNLSLDLDMKQNAWVVERSSNDEDNRYFVLGLTDSTLVLSERLNSFDLNVFLQFISIKIRAPRLRHGLQACAFEHHQPDDLNHTHSNRSPSSAANTPMTAIRTHNKRERQERSARYDGKRDFRTIKDAGSRSNPLSSARLRDHSQRSEKKHLFDLGNQATITLEASKLGNVGLSPRT